MKSTANLYYVVMIGLEHVGPSRLANGSASALVTSSMKMATKKKRQLRIAGFFCKKTKNTEKVNYVKK